MDHPPCPEPHAECAETAPAPAPEWYVYLLECADGAIYCGVTTDLARRVRQHNGQLPGGARYTRARRPVRLLASRRCADRSEACALEHALKRLRRADKLAFFSVSTSP